jgi:hypothetical protein
MKWTQFERKSITLGFEIYDKDKTIFLSKIGLLAYTCLVDFFPKNLLLKKSARNGLVTIPMHFVD